MFPLLKPADVVTGTLKADEDSVDGNKAPQTEEAQPPQSNEFITQSTSDSASPALQGSSDAASSFRIAATDMAQLAHPDTADEEHGCHLSSKFSETAGTVTGAIEAAGDSAELYKISPAEEIQASQSSGFPTQAISDSAPAALQESSDKAPSFTLAAAEMKQPTPAKTAEQPADEGFISEPSSTFTEHSLGALDAIAKAPGDAVTGSIKDDEDFDMTDGLPQAENTQAFQSDVHRAQATSGVASAAMPEGSNGESSAPAAEMTQLTHAKTAVLPADEEFVSEPSSTCGEHAAGASNVPEADKDFAETEMLPQAEDMHISQSEESSPQAIIGPASAILQGSSNGDDSHPAADTHQLTHTETAAQSVNEDFVSQPSGTCKEHAADASDAIKADDGSAETAKVPHAEDLQTSKGTAYQIQAPSGLAPAAMQGSSNVNSSISTPAADMTQSIHTKTAAQPAKEDPVGKSSGTCAVQASQSCP